MIDLSIIIVSWNVADYLRTCLDSILSGRISLIPPDREQSETSTLLNIEVIVIDSYSNDHTLHILEKYPQIKTVRLARNIGFSKASNIGLAIARGRYLMLLNPDTELIGNVLPIMVEYLETHSAVGIVGPYILNTNGETQPTRHHFHNFATSLFSLEIDGRVHP